MRTGFAGGLSTGFVLLLALLLAATPAQATETPIAAYSFDEGEGSIANDSSGENDGTIEGATWAGGKYGTALRFESEEESLVSIPDDPSLQLTEAFTLEAWVRPQYQQHWLPVLTKETPGFMSYQLYAGGETPGKAEGYVSPENGKYTAVTSPEALPVRTWTHLALTCDGEDLKLYLDGALVDTAEECDVQSSSGDLLIGGNEVFSEYLNGLIDEVRLYDRALSPEEIEEDMATAISTPPSLNPVAAYSFDEGEGSLANDAFGSHHGAIEGATWVGGKYGTALHFEGEEEAAVTIPHSPELELSGSFTLEAWVRPDHSQYWTPVLAKQTDDFFGYALYANGETQGTPEGYVAQQDWEFSEAKAEEIEPRAWTHLALTCDGQTLRLYVDGALADTGSRCSAQSSEGALQIGANEVFNEWFNGTIDEVRIYDRTLGAVEIEADLLTGVEAEYNQYPVAAYSFNEGEGEVLHDAFGTNDGTIDGAEWVAEGKFGKALSFDREAEDSVEIPASLDLDLSDDFTLSAWVKPEVNEYWMPVVVRETSAYHSYALYAAGEAPSKPQGMVAERNWEASEALAEEALSVGQWAHLALTSDGEDLKLFVDGELVDTVPASSAQHSDGVLRIGGHEAWGYYFDGLIDEVRIYDRMLWPLEVQENGEAGVGPLVNVTPPQIDENAEETIALTSALGKWLGRTPITFAYQWERCEEECTVILEATSSTYTPVQADVGKKLRLKVKATNSLGSDTAFSSETSTVEESPPRFETPVTITGSRTVGSTLTADISGLKGSKPMELDYDWERCVEYCLELEEEDGTYELKAEDAASQLRIRVTAENNAGEATQKTVTTGYVDPTETEEKPILAKPPMLRGLYRVEGLLISTPGEWVGAGSIETSIQWERCDEESCEDIPGATEKEYELGSLDQGMQIKSRVTATNSLGVREGHSSRTPRILPAVNSTFQMNEASLGDVLQGVEEAEASLLSFNYSGASSGVYINNGVSTSEVLADAENKLDDENAAERPVSTFMVWGDVATAELGALESQVDERAEVPTLRPDPPLADGGALLRTEEPKFTDELVQWASVNAWSPEDEDVGDDDRALSGRFQWQPTSEEVHSFYEATGSEMAFEFDVKQINRSNDDPLPQVLGEDPGVCLPWERNDFWIGRRETSHIEHDFPDEAEFYWDTAIIDSCQYKDLTFGLFHPDELESLEIYDVDIYFDGGGAVEAPSFPWSMFWDGIWPALDNESAVGDADSSPFVWSLSMLGMHCSWSPTACVNIPPFDVDPVSTPLITEGYEAWGDESFEDYGPATFPGCYFFSNPLYPDPLKKPGVLPCYGEQ